MSVSDVYTQIIGPFGALFILLFIAALFLTNQLFLKREVTYRDDIIERQAKQLDQQQELFDGALALLRQQRGSL